MVEATATMAEFREPLTGPRAALQALAAAETAVPPAVAEDVAATVTAALAGAGWIVVYANMIGEEIVFVRDQAVEVAAEYAGLPRFDRDELAVLAEQRPSADRLRAIVDVKREAPGTRVVVDSGEPLASAQEIYSTTAANTEPLQGGRVERRK
jgi:hypothetical protein